MAELKKRAAQGASSQHRLLSLGAAALVVAMICLALDLVFGHETALASFAGAMVLLFILSLLLGLRLLEEGDRSEQRIAARDVRYRQTLALLPEGVVILGEGERVEWWNVAAQRHMGITDAALGRPFFDVVSDDRLRCWFDERRFLEPYLWSPIGRESTYELAVVAPDVRHTFIVTHDTTAKERIDAVRRDFVANVSHELRTPLTVIAGFLEMEREAEDMPASVREYHRRLMSEQVGRMRHIVEDLLMLSGLENRDEVHGDDSEVVAMERVIESAVAEARALSNGRHRFEVRLERIALLGHADELRSAVINLVTNAVRYTPDGGLIRVTWARSGTSAVLSVEDTGIGIKAEHIPRLTERFYRVDKGRSRDTGGTGLGLAIVKHVLRRNGGTLHIESEFGKGSTFSMRFPEERAFESVGQV